MKLKTLKIQLIILFVLLLVIELVLRINHHPGTLDSSIYPLETIEYEPTFRGDSHGITSYVENSTTDIMGYIINNEGFRSSINFDQKTIDSIRNIEQKKIVFLIGDSYTEGCCTGDITTSFADLLLNHDEYCILNFGVGGTGLVQYKLIVDKYVKLLKPDLVLIAFYLGNDLVKFDRPIVPNIPLTYTIKDYIWLKSIKAPWYMDGTSKNYFETPEEAYHFYISKYTLWGKDRSIFEKTIRHSVLLSKIYLGISEKRQQFKWMSKNYSKEISLQLTTKLLDDIKSTCLKHNIQLSLVAIPSPKDALKEVDLNQKYGRFFKNISHDFPDISLFSKDDYDGLKTSNHFNESGHRIFYEFLVEHLEKEFQTTFN